MLKFILHFLRICLIFISLTSFIKPASKKKIQWITMEQAYAKSKKEPRKILIDIYTDWCGWCKVMDRETYTDKKVVEYINEKYYAVKFNAEQKEEVKLGGNRYVSTGRVHELALALTNNKASYPTTVFLESNFDMIQPLPGYFKAQAFHEVVTYFGEGYNKKEAFDQYKGATYTQLFQAQP
jgi:thioredoxin-related protein